MGGGSGEEAKGRAGRTSVRWRLDVILYMVEMSSSQKFIRKVGLAVGQRT